ncbi:MAG: methyltransferase family protein [Tepidisphaerales bacterium]
MTITTACVVLLGLIVGFYWGRVLKLVRKTRRTTGRSAQFLPAEPLGRLLRIVWYPTVVLWVLHPWLTAGSAVFGYGLPWAMRPVVESGVLAVVAVAFAAAALYGTLVCWRRMGKSWRMGINPGEKTELVVSGPYAYVAHPIYALQQVLALASLAVLPTPVMAVVAAVELVFLQWEARREERYLCDAHGAVYADYLRRVGRFVPRSWRAFSTTAARTSDA